MEWAGDSYPEPFSVDASDLGVAINERRKWVSNLNLEHYDDFSIYRPNENDPKQHSEISNDVNWLHRYDDIVKEVSDEYGFLNSPVQEEALVNQGMSIADIFVPQVESDLDEIECVYTAVIYATEDGEPDEVIIEENEESAEVEVKPGGNSDSLDAGRILTDESDQDYGGHHNEHLLAVMDLAVGRGRDTPGSTRNGELLQNNRIEVNKEIDWSKVSELEFRLEERNESAEYNVDVVYQNGERVDQALTYEEISTYLQGFDELGTVDERKESGFEFPAEGLMAFTPQGVYLNSLSAANKMLEASTEGLRNKARIE
ncbi:MAG: hypothetical protein V5A72_01170 [Candidatus Nanohaloarchaea archaeon]